MTRSLRSNNSYGNGSAPTQSRRSRRRRSISRNRGRVVVPGPDKPLLGRGAGAARRMERHARSAGRACLRTRFVWRQLEAPQGAQWIAALGHRGAERGQPAGTGRHDGARNDLAAEALDGRQHRQQRTSRGQDVVYEQDALTLGDAEATPELAPRGPVRILDLFGEDAADTQLPGGFEGQDYATGRRPGHDVNHR